MVLVFTDIRTGGHKQLLFFENASLVRDIWMRFCDPTIVLLYVETMRRQLFVLWATMLILVGQAWWKKKFKETSIGKMHQLIPYTAIQTKEYA